MRQTQEKKTNKKKRNLNASKGKIVKNVYTTKSNARRIDVYFVCLFDDDSAVTAVDFVFFLSSVCFISALRHIQMMVIRVGVHAYVCVCECITVYQRPFIKVAKVMKSDANVYMSLSKWVDNPISDSHQNCCSCRYYAC